YEISTILENLQYTDLNSWEQTRFLVYTNIQMNSKKKYSLTDILKFKWDNQYCTNTEITNTDIDRLKNKSKNIYKAIIQQTK
ncbi:MAG: hypothetical protein K2L48_02830, partial [Mycoplasmoidaceae bacterium]|nr:hypothetical protein [Mycoplasmoidaceae bacterium]